MSYKVGILKEKDGHRFIDHSIPSECIRKNAARERI